MGSASVSTSLAPASIAAATISSESAPSRGTLMSTELLELPRDRPRPGQAATCLGEDGAHVRRGPIAVVGRGLDEDRDAAGAVALVHDLLELLGLVATARTLDGALDVVRGHVHRARLVHGETQPKFASGSGATARAASTCRGPSW